MLLYFQITDPMKAVYEIALPDASRSHQTTRNVLGEMDLDETLTSRDTINRKLRTILDEATDKWGVKVNRVELQDINPPATSVMPWKNRCAPNAIAAPRSCRRKARSRPASWRRKATSRRDRPREGKAGLYPASRVMPKPPGASRGGGQGHRSDPAAVSDADTDPVSAGGALHRQPEGAGRRGRQHGLHALQATAALGSVGIKELWKVGERVIQL